jgi:hypothetical protein
MKTGLYLRDNSLRMTKDQIPRVLYYSLFPFKEIEKLDPKIKISHKIQKIVDKYEINEDNVEKFNIHKIKDKFDGVLGELLKCMNSILQEDEGTILGNLFQEAEDEEEKEKEKLEKKKKSTTKETKNVVKEKPKETPKEKPKTAPKEKPKEPEKKKEVKSKKQSNLQTSSSDEETNYGDVTCFYPNGIFDDFDVALRSSKDSQKFKKVIQEDFPENELKKLKESTKRLRESVQDPLAESLSQIPKKKKQNEDTIEEFSSSEEDNDDLINDGTFSMHLLLILFLDLPDVTRKKLTTPERKRMPRTSNQGMKIRGHEKVLFTPEEEDNLKQGVEKYVNFNHLTKLGIGMLGNYFKKI